MVSSGYGVRIFHGFVATCIRHLWAVRSVLAGFMFWLLPILPRLGKSCITAGKCRRRHETWKGSSDLAQTLHGVFRGFEDCLWFRSCITADIARLVHCILCESRGLSWKHSWAQVCAMTQLNKGTFGCSPARICLWATCLFCPYSQGSLWFLWTALLLLKQTFIFYTTVLICIPMRFWSDSSDHLH